jgi:hypothetical protein
MHLSGLPETLKGKSKVGFSDPAFAYGVTTLDNEACFILLG